MQRGDLAQEPADHSSSGAPVTDDRDHRAGRQLDGERQRPQLAVRRQQFRGRLLADRIALRQRFVREQDDPGGQRLVGQADPGGQEVAVSRTALPDPLGSADQVPQHPRVGVGMAPAGIAALGGAGPLQLGP